VRSSPHTSSHMFGHAITRRLHAAGWAQAARKN
jgi:hypothetical protein